MLVTADTQDRDNSLALTKILAIFVIKLKGGLIKPLKQSIADPNYKKAINFLSEYSDDISPFRDMYKIILNKSSVVFPYAEPLGTYLRKLLNSNNFKNKLDIISPDTKQVLLPVISMLINPESKNDFTRINKSISLLKEPALTAEYVKLYSELAALMNQGEGDQTPSPSSVSKPKPFNIDTHSTLLNIENKIKSVAKALTGKDDVTLISTEDKAKYKLDPKKAELLKQFNALRKQLSDTKINEVRSVIVSSGKQVLPVKDVVKGLKERGIKTLTIPKGLQSSTVVYMNTDAQYCDKDGRVAIRQGANQEGTIFEHNESYDPNSNKKGSNWLFRMKSPAGTINYVSTAEKIASAKAARFEKIDKSLENGIENAKSHWRGSMTNEYENDRVTYAYIMEYLFWTASRVGATEGMTDGSRTYGATNFLVKHIKNLPKSKGAKPSRLTISYPIKSGAEDTFVLSTNVENLPSKNDSVYMKRLISFVLAKTADKKPDDIVFTIKGKRIDTNKLNSFINQNLKGFTAKDFRTLRGTELAIYALDQAKTEFYRLKEEAKNGKVPQSTVNALFDAAMSSVGELLGHVRNTDEGQKVTAITAIGNYVNPKPMLDWFKEIEYAPPMKVIRAAKNAGIEV